MKKIKTVNAWNGWDPLKQCILGNAFNTNFFSGVKDPETRDLLTKLLVETKEDLDNFQKQMELAGVDVIRLPEDTLMSQDTASTFEEAVELLPWDNWSNGGLPRPMITPRDFFLTMGDKFMLTTTMDGPRKMAQELVEDHSVIDDSLYMMLHDAVKNAGHDHLNNENGDSIPRGPFVDLQKRTNTDQYIECAQTYSFWAPALTRVGNYIIADEVEKTGILKYMQQKYPHLKQGSVAIGGHSDGCFCPIKPGHIVTTEWQTDYSDTFPGWDVHVIQNENLDENIYSRDMKRFQQLRNTKKQIDRTWWTPEAKENPEFCKFVNSWLHEWTGWSVESIFEVNMLVINPELVFCSNYNKGVFDYFESIGVTPHIVPFRHRHFWDGGLHCLTLDTYREGGMQDYFNK